MDKLIAGFIGVLGLLASVHTIVIDEPGYFEASVPPYLIVDKMVSPTQIYMKDDQNTPNKATVTLSITGAGDPIAGEETKAPADIVFVVDSTGSMDDEIDDVKSKIDNIIEEIESTVDDIQFGLATYRDHPGRYGGCGYYEEYGELGDWDFRIDTHLTTNRYALKQAVHRMNADGGSDKPESVADAIIHTTYDFQWRGGDVAKIALLIGDAPGHDCENDYDTWGDYDSTGPCPNGLTMLGVIESSLGMGVKWATIGIDDTERPDKVGWAQWNYIAERTNGVSRALGDHDLADVIVELVEEIEPSIHTAGESAVVTEVLPPYIIPSNFQPWYDSFDGVDTYTWNLGAVGIGQITNITFTIEATEVGYQKLADVYPDTRLAYLAWNGTDFTTPSIEVFPQAFIDVLGSNSPPTSDGGGPYTIDEGDTVMLDGTASSDPNNDILEYRWDVLGQGNWTEWSDSPYLNQTFGDDWTGISILEVREKDTPDQFTDTSEALVTVRNVNPSILALDYTIHRNDPRTIGYWGHQCGVESPHGDQTGIVQEWVDDISAQSSVFSQISTKEQVCGIVQDGDAQDMDVMARRQLMGTWLNLVSGKLHRMSGLDMPSLTSASTVREAVENVESTILSSTDRSELENAKDISDNINQGKGVAIALVDFSSTATDQGSDDLTFSWDFGDGCAQENTYPNNGTFPIEVSDQVSHSYFSAPKSPLVLVVRDDDGGSAEMTVSLPIQEDNSLNQAMSAVKPEIGFSCIEPQDFEGLTEVWTREARSSLCQGCSLSYPSLDSTSP